ncbi:MAG: helix-hairpin-helix domain-containing protein [Bacteroidota bacterium]
MLDKAEFTFTHSQKKGILLLVLILLVAMSALFVFKHFIAQRPYDQPVMAQNFAQPVIVQDSTLRLDINLADSSQWSQLKGIGPKLSQRIIRYRNSIGGFRNVEQVASVYGINQDLFSSIESNLYYNRFSAPPSPSSSTSKAQKRSYPKLDINTATAEDFEALPGIGKTLSKRIVKYRNTLGGFSSTDQLKRVYYLEPEIFQQIKPYLYLEVPASIFAKEENQENEELKKFFATANESKVEDVNGQSRGAEKTKKSAAAPKPSEASTPIPIIDLNKADSTSLALLPELKKKLVLRILKYRKLLGFFYDVDQLKQVYGLSPTTFARISPYLKVESVDKFPKKDLNIVFARNLAFYPFIDKTIAEAIISERKALGHFKNWEEVLAVPGVSSEILQKLRIYFEI